MPYDDKDDDDDEKYEPVVCPSCHGEPSHNGGCSRCDNDGWIYR